MSSRDSRKQLLIAESELNRARLIEECGEMAEDIRILSQRMQSLSSVATTVGFLAKGVSAIGLCRSVVSGSKVSWIQTALKGAQLAREIWVAYRARH